MTAALDIAVSRDRRVRRIAEHRRQRIKDVERRAAGYYIANTVLMAAIKEQIDMVAMLRGSLDKALVGRCRNCAHWWDNSLNDTGWCIYHTRLHPAHANYGCVNFTPTGKVKDAYSNGENRTADR